MKDAAVTLRNHRQDIPAYFHHRITNAVCKGVNYTYEGFAAMIYLIAGKLKLAVPRPF